MAPSCIVCFVAGFLTCSPANKCDTCEICYYLEDCKICSSDPGICDICIDGFLIGKNGKCEACFLGCKTCTSAINANACSSCVEGYFFD